MLYVYFIFSENSDYGCKIGYTNDPKRRLSDLQTGSKDVLEVYKYIEHEKADKIEKIIHKEMNFFNIHGEWFNIHKKQVDDIVDFYSKLSEKDLCDLGSDKRVFKKKKSETSKDISDINDATNTAEEERKYVCKYCDKAFPDRKGLWRHKNRKKYSCMPKEQAENLYGQDIHHRKKIEELNQEKRLWEKEKELWLKEKELLTKENELLKRVADTIMTRN